MNEATRQKIMQNREILKGHGSWDVGAEPTDQQQKLPYLPPEKPPMSGNAPIPLPLDFEESVEKKDLAELIKERESQRSYAEEPITLKELSFLLWAVQGVRKLAGKMKQVTFRTVPSAGSRHAMETYLFVRNVEGLKPGKYHYLAISHSLELLEAGDFGESLTEALCGQSFAGYAPVTFVFSAVPYRMEWRYGLQSAKYILLDAGHAVEHLYPASGAVGCGTCAIGAYDQERLDELMGFAPGPSAEREYECAIYAAPVGKIEKDAE